MLFLVSAFFLDTTSFQENCSEQLLRCGSDVAFLSCDAVKVPLRDSSVDAVVTDLP